MRKRSNEPEENGRFAQKIGRVQHVEKRSATWMLSSMGHLVNSWVSGIFTTNIRKVADCETDPF